MKATTAIGFVLLALVVGFILAKVTGGGPCPPPDATAAIALRTKAIEDSITSAHIIDSLNRIIAAERITIQQLDHADSLINANPKYRANAYRDSSTAAKLDFIIGADRR